MSQENNKLLGFFKENGTMILLALYSISFVNYYLYYYGFEISIFNYVGLNDLIFFSLVNIFQILLIVVIFEILFYLFSALFFEFCIYCIFIFKKKKLSFSKYSIDKKIKIRKRWSEFISKKYFDKNIDMLRIFVPLILIFILVKYPYKLLTFPALLVYILFGMYILEKNEKEIRRFVYTASFVVIASFSIISTLNSSYNKRFKKDDYNMSFIENSKLISTDKKISNYNYLGETSSHIFLYDIKAKESRIYSKSSISEVKIKNNNKIDSIILATKNNFFIKHFIELLNSDNPHK